MDRPKHWLSCPSILAALVQNASDTAKPSAPSDQVPFRQWFQQIIGACGNTSGFPSEGKDLHYHGPFIDGLLVPLA